MLDFCGHNGFPVFIFCPGWSLMKQNRIKICVLLLTAVLFLALPVVPVETGKNERVASVSSDTFRTELSVLSGVGAECAFLYAPESNTVLFSQNADRRHGMASTTKIMTAITALELLPLDKAITVDKEMTGVEGSSIYLVPGETLTAEQLLYGLMLESGNDAAVALAIACAGSVERFVFFMNAKAALLGCKDTRFANPHGLSDNGHYTTARELALLTAYAMENETFRKIVSTYSVRIPYKDTENGRLLVNHNPILRSFDGLIGVKTGWTTLDGKCFVTAAERNGLTLIAVSLGDTNISATHRQMLEAGFSACERTVPTVETTFRLALVGGKESFADVEVASLPAFCLPKGASVSARIEAPAFLYAGVRKGETVGRVVFLWNGKEIGQAELVCAENTEVRHISFWEKVFG